MESREPTVASPGEFGLIERIARLLGEAGTRGAGVQLGIGDDAAVLDLGGDQLLLATVDMLVEDVHFRRSDDFGKALGRRALTASCSDVAAMGGVPRHALVSLGVAPNTPLAEIDDLYAGLAAAGRDYGVAVVGGNLARTGGSMVVDVTVLGTVPKGELVERSGARPGDLIAVSGPLGAAGALRGLQESSTGSPQLLAELSEEATPKARVREGRALASAGLARAMIDISDGLAGDLRHICRASRVDAGIVAADLPLSRATRHAANLLHLDPTHLALTGGEDYELLLAIEPARQGDAAALVPDIRVIGTFMDAGSGMSLLLPDGRRAPLPPGSWTHF